MITNTDTSPLLLQVSGISFSPEGEEVAISYCSPDFLTAATWELPTSGHIFSLRDPTRCLAQLGSESCVTSLQYSRQVNLLAGGCYSGQVSCWDLRTSSRSLISSSAPLSSAHTEPVHCLVWTSSKTGTEVMTTSEDGFVKWWDVRKLEVPTSRWQLQDMDKSWQVLSG